MASLLSFHRRLSGLLRRGIVSGGPDRTLDAMEAYLSASDIPENTAAAGCQPRRDRPLGPGIAIDEENTGHRTHGNGIAPPAGCPVLAFAAALAMECNDEGMAAALAMSPRTRAVLQLRIAHGLSTREIARNFDLAPWKVRRHLRLAVRAVVKSLGP